MSTHYAHSLRRVGSVELLIAVLAITMSLAAVMASTASAENPLYCDGWAYINEGCQGPTTQIHTNEARNENGGCIAVQIWARGYGYSEPYEVCNGKVAAQSLNVRVESFPKCWNRTNARDEIHCRYEPYTI